MKHKRIAQGRDEISAHAVEQGRITWAEAADDLYRSGTHALEYLRYEPCTAAMQAPGRTSEMVTDGWRGCHTGELCGKFRAV